MHMQQAKKHGKQADISEFRAQLDALGLKIIQVTADGNCFFRFVLSKINPFLHVGLYQNPRECVCKLDACSSLV